MTNLLLYYPRTLSFVGCSRYLEIQICEIKNQIKIIHIINNENYEKT